MFDLLGRIGEELSCDPMGGRFVWWQVQSVNGLELNGPFLEDRSDASQ